MTRTARVERETSETKLVVEVDLDGTGATDISTGVGFYDHMLTAFAAYAGFAATVALWGNRDWAMVGGVAVLGLGLLGWGYAQARLDAVPLFALPHGMAMGLRHLVALLVLVAFWLLVAAYVPRNHLKAAVKHPMVLAVKLWAFAHLLANNTLADLLLFGSFLVWAVLDFRSSRQRDRAAGTVYPPGSAGRTVAAVVLGVALWALFAFWLHGLLFGVRPFGR